MTTTPESGQAASTPPTAAERPRRVRLPRSSEPTELLTGTVLGKYRIGRRLGSGGMGVVYQASHVEIGKQVALKVLSADLAEGTHARSRFLREAAAASKIDHPNVVRVTDYGAEAGMPYLVMELLKGEDLASLLRRNRAGLPLPDAGNILLAVCAAVHTAHEARVIHRDLKPRNIFLARTRLFEMGPKILDFGISRLEDEDGQPSASLTDPGAVLGTTHYLSPEQAGGRRADARSDQYALGVVLYECLTGRRPHEGHESPEILRRIREGVIDPPRRWRTALPDELEAIVLRAMALAPGDRFPSAHALGAALLPFAAPKQQVAWMDYYQGPSERTAETAPVAEPAPVPTAPTMATVYLPAQAGDSKPTPDSDTRTVHRGSESGSETVSEILPVTSPPMRVRPRSRGWLLLLIVGAATFAGTTWLLRNWPRQAPPTAASVPSPPSAPASPSPSASPALPEPEPAPTAPPAVAAEADSTPKAAPAPKADPAPRATPTSKAPVPLPSPLRRDLRRPTLAPPPAIRAPTPPHPTPTPLAPAQPPAPQPREPGESPSPAPILH